ncbi:MAG TPA: inosine/xanthosine triphosphatase [Alphaproteobacteria bacterium]|nr:inosine/xanthosine triphosphatase [Alphaproteobacteria bacterium]
MKIILGSQNAAKLKAVEDGVKAYWPEAVVTGHDVPSGVPAQPLGHEQTLQGALNRARAAHALGADLGIGLEGGVVGIHGTPIMMSYVAVTDGTREVVVPVTGMPLPHSWGQALEKGAELRPFVMQAGLPYDYKSGVVGTLTNNQMSRDELFAVGVKTALVPWANPAAFGETAAA